MYLKIKKLIPVTTFLITSLASFTVLDLYYFSTHSLILELTSHILSFLQTMEIQPDTDTVYYFIT